jgi:hypothetical protein
MKFLCKVKVYANLEFGCQMVETIQIRRVAANILNKSLWLASKGWSSSLEVGQGTNNSSP